MLMTESYNIFYRKEKTTVKMRVVAAFLCLISVTLAFTLPEQEEPAEDYLTVEQEDFKPFDEENNEPGLFDDEDENEPRSFDDEEEDELGVADDEEDDEAGLFDDEDENEPGFLDEEPGVPYVEDE